MTNDEIKNLGLSLFQADTENRVIEILKSIGFWDDPKAWRYYGDREDNFSIIGNQQSRPEAALVEKIVNSVDAVLMNGCWLSGLTAMFQNRWILSCCHGSCRGCRGVSGSFFTPLSRHTSISDLPPDCSH